jgi:hypothetical protein
MSAPPFNYKGGGNRYKYNYTLTGVDIKEISDKFVNSCGKKMCCKGLYRPYHLGDFLGAQCLLANGMKYSITLGRPSSNVT